MVALQKPLGSDSPLGEVFDLPRGPRRGTRLDAEAFAAALIAIVVQLPTDHRAAVVRWIAEVGNDVAGVIRMGDTGALDNQLEGFERALDLVDRVEREALPRGLARVYAWAREERE